jgi:hypothetical protein
MRLARAILSNKNIYPFAKINFYIFKYGKIFNFDFLNSHCTRSLIFEYAFYSYSIACGGATGQQS